MSNETIVDRVVARLKSQPLGDLITEEDLHDIVKQAIPKTFFEKRVIPQGQYHTQTLDPLIVDIMRDLLKDAARKITETWLTENKETMLQYWKEVCDAGLIQYVQKIQSMQANMEIFEVLKFMRNQINDARMQKGMSTLPHNAFFDN